MCVIGLRSSTLGSVRLSPFQGNTALHIAATESAYQIADVLLESGADPCVKNVHGKTPLQAGCIQNAAHILVPFQTHAVGRLALSSQLAKASNNPAVYEVFEIDRAEFLERNADAQLAHIARLKAFRARRAALHRTQRQAHYSSSGFAYGPRSFASFNQSPRMEWF